jgi:hypothetical protein
LLPLRGSVLSIAFETCEFGLGCMVLTLPRVVSSIPILPSLLELIRIGRRQVNADNEKVRLDGSCASFWVAPLRSGGNLA